MQSTTVQEDLLDRLQVPVHPQMVCEGRKMLFLPVGPLQRRRDRERIRDQDEESLPMPVFGHQLLICATLFLALILPL